MMSWAQVTGGIVTAGSASVTEPAGSGDWIACPGGTAVGFTYDGTTFTPPQGYLLAYADAKAAQLISATRSYTAAGITLKADATSGTIANLLALAQWGQTNIAASENWVADDYSVTSITGAQFVALAPMVGAYAQLICGTQLAAVLGQIRAGTITTTGQIDAYGWTA